MIASKRGLTGAGIAIYMIIAVVLILFVWYFLSQSVAGAGGNVLKTTQSTKPAGCIPLETLYDCGVCQQTCCHCVGKCEKADENIKYGERCDTMARSGGTTPTPAPFCTVDNDYDGYCAAGSRMSDGSPVPADRVDCNENDWYTYPGAPEMCDGKDNDCATNTNYLDGEKKTCDFQNSCGAFGVWCPDDGSLCTKQADGTYECAVPPPDPSRNCVTDSDGDGYCKAGTTMADGSAIPADRLDCDDNNGFVNPGMQEFCSNGVDDNCDGKTDDTSCLNWCVNSDKDSAYVYAAATNLMNSVPCPANFVPDCNDNDPAVQVASTEICDDGIDEACNGFSDESWLATPNLCTPQCTGTPTKQCRDFKDITSCHAAGGCDWNVIFGSGVCQGNLQCGQFGNKVQCNNVGCAWQESCSDQQIGQSYPSYEIYGPGPDNDWNTGNDNVLYGDFAGPKKEAGVCQTLPNTPNYVTCINNLWQWDYAKTAAQVGRVYETEEGNTNTNNCNDRLDNDCDGLVDCGQLDCNTRTWSQGEFTNGVCNQFCTSLAQTTDCSTQGQGQGQGGGGGGGGGGCGTQSQSCVYDVDCPTGYTCQNGCCA